MLGVHAYLLGKNPPNYDFAFVLNTESNSPFPQENLNQGYYRTHTT